MDPEILYDSGKWQSCGKHDIYLICLCGLMISHFGCVKYCLIDSSGGVVGPFGWGQLLLWLVWAILRRMLPLKYHHFNGVWSKDLWLTLPHRLLSCQWSLDQHRLSFVIEWCIGHLSFSISFLWHNSSLTTPKGTKRKGEKMSYEQKKKLSPAHELPHEERVRKFILIRCSLFAYCFTTILDVWNFLLHAQDRVARNGGCWIGMRIIGPFVGTAGDLIFLLFVCLVVLCVYIFLVIEMVTAHLLSWIIALRFHIPC